MRRTERISKSQLRVNIYFPAVSRLPAALQAVVLSQNSVRLPISAHVKNQSQRWSRAAWDDWPRLACCGSIDIVGWLCASFSCRLEQATIEACSVKPGRYQETQVVTRIQLAPRQFRLVLLTYMTLLLLQGYHKPQYNHFLGVMSPLYGSHDG
jgi:hypothetical protein